MEGWEGWERARWVGGWMEAWREGRGRRDGGELKGHGEMGRGREGGREAMVCLLLELLRVAPSPTVGPAAWHAVPTVPGTVPTALGLLCPTKSTQHVMAPGRALLPAAVWPHPEPDPSLGVAAAGRQEAPNPAGGDVDMA